MLRRRKKYATSNTPYYPSQYRGHQCLIFDDRTVIGWPDRPR